MKLRWNDENGISLRGCCRERLKCRRQNANGWKTTFCTKHKTPDDGTTSFSKPYDARRRNRRDPIVRENYTQCARIRAEKWTSMPRWFYQIIDPWFVHKLHNLGFERNVDASGKKKSDNVSKTRGRKRLLCSYKKICSWNTQLRAVVCLIIMLQQFRRGSRIHSLRI